MKKFLTVASVFVFAVSLVACGAGMSSAAPFNDVPHYTVDVPEGWEVNYVEAAEALKVEKDWDKVVQIMFRETDIKTDADSKAKFDRSWAEPENKRQIKDNIVVGGVNCRVMEFEGFDGATETMLFGVRNGLELTIQITGMPLSDAKPVIDSIKWK